MFSSGLNQMEDSKGVFTISMGPRKKGAGGGGICSLYVKVTWVMWALFPLRILRTS